MTLMTRFDRWEPFEELNTLVGFDEAQAIERRFLTQDQMARKYGSS